MKKIIITGGLGYLGSHLSKRFIDEGFKVFIFDNYFTNVCSTIKGARVIKCDITNYESLKR